MPLLRKSHIRAIYGWDPVLFFNSILKGFKLHKISSSLVIRNDGSSKPTNVDHYFLLGTPLLFDYLSKLDLFFVCCSVYYWEDSGACLRELSLAWLFFHRLWQDLNVFVSACWDWLADFLICSQCWYSFLWPLFLQRATCLPGRCFSGGLLYYCYPQELIAYSRIRQDCSC